MQTRRIAAALIAAITLIPATGHATTRYGAPYTSAGAYDWCVTSQWPAYTGTPSSTCTLNDHADAATGAIHTEISIQSPGGGTQPGYGEAFATGDITATVVLSKPSSRPVTISETVRLTRAFVRHDGALQGVPHGWATVDLDGQIMQTQCGDCDWDLTHQDVTVADLDAGPSSSGSQDVTLQFVLKSASGVVPAGTYTTRIGLMNYVRLSHPGPAGDYAQTGTVYAYADGALSLITVR